MKQKKRTVPPLTREQELMQEFQQGEAAEERDLEPVDKQMRNVRRTWADMVDAGEEE